jgi:hypothetical protein
VQRRRYIKIVIKTGRQHRKVQRRHDIKNKNKNWQATQKGAKKT